MKRTLRSSLPLLALSLAFACSDDEPTGTAEPDASQALDAGSDASPLDAMADAANSADAGNSGDAAAEVARKPACSLLTAGEVAAVIGAPQVAMELVGGQQCQFSSTDPERKNVRGLLEIVGNGRAIYAANVKMYSELNMPLTPQSGIGDQAAFLSESVSRSSMISTKGDVLVRINLGWGDPGADSATQLAGERSLMLTALGRL